MRVETITPPSNSGRCWNILNWITFILLVCLQAISFTIHLDLGVKVVAFPIAQAAFAILLVLLAMSAILYRSPTLCKVYAATASLFAAFGLTYIVWKIVYGFDLLKEDNPDLS